MPQIDALATVLVFLDNSLSDNGLGGMFAAMGLIWMLVVGACIIVGIVAYWRIAEKAGYTGAMSLLMLIPLANLIIFLIFAFSEWPIEARLRAEQGVQPQLPGA